MARASKNGTGLDPGIYSKRQRGDGTGGGGTGGGGGCGAYILYIVEKL